MCIKDVTDKNDYIYLNKFIWDVRRNNENQRKHNNLSFEIACRIFNDFLCEDYDFNHSDREDREKFIGSINGILIVTVIDTEREELIRIISARKATKDEVKIYEENTKRIQGY